MKRPLLALCLSLVTGLAIAGEVSGGIGNDEAPLCPKAAAKAATQAPVADAGAPVAASPAPAARVRGGGGTTSTRLTSPRWHSLLPGMFR
jgi:hypothetical protein